MGLPKFGHLYRLTRHPELTYSGNGVAICKTGLACSEKYNDKETQFFIDAVAFKKTAEMLNNVKKGQRVFVTGKIQTDKWQDKDTGQNRSKPSLIMEYFEFIEPKDNNQSSGQQNQGFQAPQQHTGSQQGFHQQQPQQQQQGGFQRDNGNSGGNAGFQGQQDDSIPF